MDNIRSGSTTNGGSASSGPPADRTVSRSSTIIDDDAGYETFDYNPHAGEILFLDFMEPLAMSQNALARAIGVSPRRINEIVHGRRAITADTSLRLERYFNMSEGFFLGLQNEYDIRAAKKAIAADLDAIVPRPRATGPLASESDEDAARRDAGDRREAKARAGKP